MALPNAKMGKMGSCPFFPDYQNRGHRQCHPANFGLIDFLNSGGLNQAGIDGKPTRPRFPLRALRAWVLHPSTMGDPRTLFLAGARRARTCQKGTGKDPPQRGKRTPLVSCTGEARGAVPDGPNWHAPLPPLKSGTAPGAHNAKVWPIRGCFRRTKKFHLP